MKSQPVYGSHGIDVNKDTDDDDVFSSSTNNHQIKIIREDHNQSSINSASKASPYKLNDDLEIPDNNNNSTSTATSTTSPERHDIHKATSAGNLYLFIFIISYKLIILSNINLFQFRC